jgi:ribosome-associated protein
MIRITDAIAIAESELTFRFFTAQGPGGQNVNKVASAAHLTFDAADSSSLPEEVVRRLRGVAGRRMTAAGVVIIRAQRFRSQERNKENAIERLVHLLARAAEPPTIRVKHRPTRGMIERRLDVKRRRATTKRTRGPVRDVE